MIEMNEDIIAASLAKAVMAGGSNANIQVRTQPITQNATYHASDEGLDGWSGVRVEVPVPSRPVTMPKEHRVNASDTTYYAANENPAKDGYSSFTVTS